jgi:hypothetical protein
VVYPEETLLFPSSGQFPPSLLVNSSSCPSRIPKRLQDEWLRTKNQNGCRDAKLFSYLYIHDLSKESVLFSKKQFKYLFQEDCTLRPAAGKNKSPYLKNN